MQKVQKKQKTRRKYKRVGCLAWAVEKLWQLDRRFVLLSLAGVPLAVFLPLAESYFTKMLIDGIGMGKSFRFLARRSVCFAGGIILLALLKELVASKCNARRYFPTVVYQTEMSSYENYWADYENTEKQEFREISGYAWNDANRGDCALEFFWQDMSQALSHLFGMITYASFLVILNPVILAVTAAVSLASYFTTRWQPSYYEKNKHRWEKETRKSDYLQRLSEDFSGAKDIKLYGLEGWLEKMMRDYQSYILMWNKRCSLRGLWAAMLSGLLALLQNAAVYFVLIGTLLAGSITVGEFVFYFGLAGSLAGFLQGIIGDVAALNSRADKIAYYREFYDYPNIFHHGQGCELPAGPVTIEFRDVRYRYDGAKEDTLKESIL